MRICWRTIKVDLQPNTLVNFLNVLKIFKKLLFLGFTLQQIAMKD